MDYARDCTPDDAPAVARLLFEGFREMPRVFGTRHNLARLIRAGFSDPGACITAREDGELKGLAMLDFGGRSLLKFKLRHFLKEYGLLEGLGRAALGALLASGLHRGRFYLDVLAVGSECRGEGIGGRLLEEVEADALRQGYASVFLDVVDENPRARELYERVGYEGVRHRRTVLYRWFFGVSGYTRMEKRLA